MSNSYIIQFFNKYPWYDWIILLIVLSLVLGVIWLLNNRKAEDK